MDCSWSYSQYFIEWIHGFRVQSSAAGRAGKRLGSSRIQRGGSMTAPNTKTHLGRHLLPVASPQKEKSRLAASKEFNTKSSTHQENIRNPPGPPPNQKYQTGLASEPIQSPKSQDCPSLGCPDALQAEPLAPAPRHVRAATSVSQVVYLVLYAVSRPCESS